MPFFETDFAKFHYHEYGSGEEVMLAFHGFGMRGTQFKVLEESLGKKYTIYSFDLFFHGDTVLKDDSLSQVRKGLPGRLFCQEIESFLKTKKQDFNKIALLSYSIGSKLAWCLLEQLPHRISTAYFIAPDGIEPNKLLHTIAGNKLINRFLRKLVYSPKTVAFLLNRLYKWNYIDHSLHRILKAEFGTVETRKICYNSITYYTSLLFNKRALAALINQHTITCHFYFGQKDKLFPASIGTRFGKLLHSANIHIFDEGHELVNKHLNTYLALQLNPNDKG